MEAMDCQIDNVVLIGTPIAEVWDTKTQVHMIYSTIDPLSWNLGWGFQSYCFGAVGHTAYFNDGNIDALASLVLPMIS